MDPRDFLATAELLVAEGEDPGVVAQVTEADIRSSVSRSYYGAFNTAVDLLEIMAGPLPKDGTVHGVVPTLLQASNDAGLRTAEQTLRNLRSQRNKADYRMAESIQMAEGQLGLNRARRIVGDVDAARNEPAYSAAQQGVAKEYARQQLGT